ncbi:MAG: S1-like domain-containing RNA-binding protein [Bacilli bacterium]|nr:S1-like domain-containing RNA-binding protein [Bacilli bacterium]
MNLGKIETYTVDRETKLGYVIVKDGEEYFLHHNECNGNSFIAGDKVKAFLYVDKKNRPAATLFKPFIQLNETKLLQVVSVDHKIGAFLNIGISKDILLSADELPYDYSKWPKEGDFLPCMLRIRANRLILKLSNKFEIVRVHEEVAKEQKLTKSQVVSGYAYRLSPEGVNFVTSDYDVIFVYKTNYRKSYHLGEKEEIKIIDIHEDDYTGTINKNKEFQIEDDYKIILDYLEKNNGVMLITEKSSPEIINRLFNMSKSSFKNALGRLLKQNKIEILENKIILKEE